MWYYEINGAHFGPVDTDRISDLLRSGEIDDLTRVRREDDIVWRHLDETDLACLLTGINRGRDFLEDDEYEIHGIGSSGLLSPKEPLAASGQRLWYYMKDEMVFGPLTTAEIVAMRGLGEVYGQTLVSEGNTDHWQMLDETDLADLRPDNQNQ
jgi:hypothetical protein